MSFLDNAFRDWICETIRTEIQSLSAKTIEQIVAAVRTGTAQDDLPTYLTAKQVAALVQVRADTVRSWVRNDLLPGHFAGRKLRIRLSDLQEFMRSELSAASPPKNDDVRIHEMLNAPRRKKVG